MASRSLSVIACVFMGVWRSLLADKHFHLFQHHKSTHNEQHINYHLDHVKYTIASTTRTCTSMSSSCTTSSSTSTSTTTPPQPPHAHPVRAPRVPPPRAARQHLMNIIYGHCEH
eukprot:6460948-Amphidinium_carterae.2